MHNVKPNGFCVASKTSLMFDQHQQLTSFKVLQIRILKKLFCFFNCIKGLDIVWRSLIFFASNNIAQYTVDSAKQLIAADIGHYVEINIVTCYGRIIWTATPWCYIC